jgi:hypothetical protein
MSSQANQVKKSNKKQRRRDARANLQQTQPPDNENDEINQTQAIISTQNNHEQLNDVSSVTNGIQGLVLKINEQAENV